MSKSMEKGKKFYEMRMAGLTNQQVAAKCAELPYVVSARVSDYRRAHGLPPIPRLETAKKKNKAATAPAKNPVIRHAEKEEDRRKENFKEAERLPDGVLLCPPRYCEGYGLN